MEQDTDTPRAVGWAAPGSGLQRRAVLLALTGSAVWQQRPRRWGFLSKQHLVRNIPCLKKVAFVEFLLLFFWHRLPALF